MQWTSSCPPGRVHAVSAGPWSLEWACRHKDVEIGDVTQMVPKGVSKCSQGAGRVTRKKGGGVLRHCAQNLKRIARLSDEDQQKVLRALRKSNRRRKLVSNASKDKVNSNGDSSVNGSQSSVKNEWMNWLVLHVNSKVVSEDVRGVGNVLGLKFKGDKNNRFDVLSGVGRTNKEGVGEGSYS